MESVRWPPGRGSRPASRSRSRTRSSTRCGTRSFTRRSRNSLSTEWSNPGSVSSSPRRNFQSMRPRRAAAAWRSDRPSANWSTETIANWWGGQAGRPRCGNRSTKSLSANSGPSASRIRMHRQPFGNASRATSAVRAGTSPGRRGRSDTLITSRSRPHAAPAIIPPRQQHVKAAAEFTNGVQQGARSDRARKERKHRVDQRLRNSWKSRTIYSPHHEPRLDRAGTQTLVTTLERGPVRLRDHLWRTALRRPPLNPQQPQKYRADVRVWCIRGVRLGGGCGW
ncbi:hypothetical protein C9F11_43790 (plasmid) [Streptomyces sp. YIM 121038]|nr:hypothetical protein C9F11_43790 [Streptomyces sp. YIM 121038]